MKPSIVEDAPPSAVMAPFKVAVEVPTGLAADIVTVGATTPGGQDPVVKVVFELYEVPMEFAAKAASSYVVLHVSEVTEAVYAPVP